MTRPEDPSHRRSPGEQDDQTVEPTADEAPTADEEHTGHEEPTGPQAPRRSGGPTRTREVLESVVLLRELRAEVDAVRQSVADQATNAATIYANVSEAIGLLAELIPRVEAMDTRLAEVAASVATDSDDAAAGGSDPDTPPITPAIGWDDMDHDTARAAWEALARFVGDVLHARYRLTRLQIPDCWPLHPRLIREIAWLRSSYLDAGAMEPDLPPAAAPWHIRALPSFLANMVDAVDPRECRPGIHRLTEHEVEAHIASSNKAQYEGQPAPPLTTETGEDRPRFVPDAFPTRGAAPPPRPGSDPSPPTVRTLPDLITGSCDPRWWLDYYREASAADLARRPATAPPPSAPAGDRGDGDGGDGDGGGGDGGGGDGGGGGGGGGAARPSSESSGEDGRPERFDLDSSSDDLADGGPGAPGGPGGLGGLDGPAGPL